MTKNAEFSGTLHRNTTSHVAMELDMKATLRTSLSITLSFTLLFGCAPIIDTVRDADAIEFSRYRHFVIDEKVYVHLGFRGDTLFLSGYQSPRRSVPGEAAYCSREDALRDGLDSTRFASLTLRHPTPLVAIGDTLALRKGDIQEIRARENNPAFIAGLTISALVAVGVILIAASSPSSKHDDYSGVIKVLTEWGRR